MYWCNILEVLPILIPIHFEYIWHFNQVNSWYFASFVLFQYHLISAMTVLLTLFRMGFMLDSDLRVDMKRG
jgi:hypothetical protein